MLVEHPLDRPESLEDSLGVIDAIDADAEIAHINSQLGQNFPPRGCAIAVQIAVMPRVGVSHADRKWPDQRLMPLPAYRETVPVRICFERPVHRLQKIIAMRLHMKPNQIRAQQSIQKFALPRTNSNRLRIRPRNVPEDRDMRVGPLLLDQTRQKRKVIILHRNY